MEYITYLLVFTGIMVGLFIQGICNIIKDLLGIDLWAKFKILIKKWR